MPFLKSSVVYVLLYLALALPTYLLPYVGSNSSLMHAVTNVSGVGFSPFFWLHNLFLWLLVALAWFRGPYCGKAWLPVLPFLAGVFDMTPGLNWIWLVPTALHVAAVIVGTIASTRVTEESVAETNWPVRYATSGAVSCLLMAMTLWAFYSLEHDHPLTGDKAMAGRKIQQPQQSSQPPRAGTPSLSEGTTPAQKSVQESRAPQRPARADTKSAGASAIVGGWYNGDNYRASIFYIPAQDAYRLRIWNNESHPDNAFETLVFERPKGTEFSDSKAQYDGDGHPPPKIVIYQFDKDSLKMYLNQSVQDKSGNAIGPGSAFSFRSDFKRDPNSIVR